jgi:protein O-GlcNAc transferase
MVNIEELVRKTTDLTRFGRFDEANKVLSKALKDDPECFEARLEQIKVALYQDKTADAHKLISEATQINPSDPRLIGLEGVWYLESKQFKNALAALSWAAQTLPEDANMHLNLAIALRNLGDYSNAEAEILTSLTLNPLSELAHYEYSRILMLTGKSQEAMMHVLKAIEINPYFVMGYMTLAEYFKSQKRIDSAIRLFEAGIKITPDIDLFYGQLALLYEQKEDFKSALKCVKHLAKKSGAYPDYLRIGIYSIILKKIPDAEKAFMQAIKLDPKRWEAYYNLGEMRLAQNKIGEATQYYREALSRVGQVDSRPYNGMGLALVVGAKGKGAEELFKKALEINPRSFEATLNMALLFKTLKDKKKAQEWAKRALALAGDDANKQTQVNRFLNDLR